MSQTKREIESLLAEASSRPRHQFGQNFMIDQNLVRLVAEAGRLTREDYVIEVGPGTGTLTEELLERAGRVIAIEIDRNLAALLRRRLGDHARFQLIEGDALRGKHQLNPQLIEVIQQAQERREHVKLVANLPYNIASPLIIEMLIAGVDLLAFTVQKEVAMRIGTSPGTKAYGPLSVMAQLLSRVEVLRTLPPQAFWPPPKIESALVRLARDDRLGSRSAPFGAFVQRLFSFRRKMLKRALSQMGFDAGRVLKTAEIDGQKRAEEFAPELLLNCFSAAATDLQPTQIPY